MARLTLTKQVPLSLEKCSHEQTLDTLTTIISGSDVKCAGCGANVVRW